MKVGDRFEKDGKYVEVTQVSSWGYGYREVKKEDEVVSPAPEIEEEKPVVRRRTTRKKA